MRYLVATKARIVMQRKFGNLEKKNEAQTPWGWKGSSSGDGWEVWDWNEWESCSLLFRMRGNSIYEAGMNSGNLRGRVQQVVKPNRLHREVEQNLRSRWGQM